MHKSYKKTVAILITCALISALCCFPVSAQSNTMSPYLEIYSYGLFTNTTTGNGFQLPGNIDDCLVFPDNSVFNNAISIWLPYSSVILNSSQYGYQDFWINPYRVGQYSMTFAVNYNNYRISDIVVESDYIKFVNSSYDYVGIKTINSVPYYMVKFNFYVSNVTANEVGNTGGWIRVGLQSYQNNISTFAAFITDITFSDGTSEIIDNQNQNTQSIIDNQNSNTQAEIEADKENTQAIIDNQNELAEQEKQEITDSGNQATDAGDNIPNESDGFINALGTFVSTMSTTDTDCSITFPAIKIPSFAGIPGATLSEEKEVDFEVAINLIPSDIMKLIQALTTIALIVFCFKELYDTISEALTRKKANSDG